MDTSKLKKFAQGARRQLIEQVSARMEQVLRSDSVEVREKAKVVEQLKAEIEAHGKAAVVDKVAYTWFNRFCALRFMDVNHYTRIGVVSPVEGGTQPEVLLEAKQGQVDDALARLVNQQVVFDLLSGRRPASDGQGEAYRLLLVGMCNSYSAVMPFLFEKIEDYTELLMPLDLLSENSVLHDLREALTPEACEDVEVIGWLYQYYISERKDQVFEALKQNQKIEAQDIPAATQLFTPHWIVRYLVENSLGRLWMLNHPSSKLREKMEYYIENSEVRIQNSEEKQSTESLHNSDFIILNSPEELRLLDPACGSGHILTYAFDLLYAIYEEQGYASSDIPKLILEKNIFGIEIDPRAGALAAFALTMKARAKDKRFFTRTVPKVSGQDSRLSNNPSERFSAQPNICVLENVSFDEAELNQYMNAVGRDLFTEPLMETLRQFEQAENFGSLIRPMLTPSGAANVREIMESKNVSGDLFLYGVHERVLKVLKFAEFLAPRYHVVVANPPYMNSGGMNDDLKDFTKEYFPDGKYDLFAAFIERSIDLSKVGGFASMITMQSWMFLSSYEKLRRKLQEDYSIVCGAHLGARAFDSISGEVVSTVAFVFEHSQRPNRLSAYIDLTDGNNEAEKASMLRQNIPSDTNIKPQKYYLASTEKFNALPGAPIAYWVSENLQKLFEAGAPISELAEVKAGMATSDNDRFLRYWHEVAFQSITFNCQSTNETIGSLEKWYPYNKGGTYRKWFGNNDYIVNWKNDGAEIKEWVVSNPKDPNTTHWSRRIVNTEYFFRECFTWSDVGAEYPSFRYLPKGFVIGNRGPGIFSKEINFLLIAFLNSIVARRILNILNPTLTFNVGDVANIPFYWENDNYDATGIVESLIQLIHTDWDFYETSWGFTHLSLLDNLHRQKSIEKTYLSVRKQWEDMVMNTQKLEKENNHVFIDAYDLREELSPDVPLGEITLTCNPYYRYNGNKTETELETLQLADTMREFISYAVGCMFGRYSLDKPGLVLANQGEGNSEFRIMNYEWQKAQGLEQKISFEPDEDNVIPVLDGEWFEDDIVERFKKFLRVTFGEEHYEENLAFIEESIGRDVRSYFVREFYKDHVQMYKKRPIYWMFSSPKGSFNVLIYMHRYQPDSVSIVLNGYLREYIKKLNAHKAGLERTSVSGSASQSQKTKALKEITQVNKILSELKEYEEVVFELASQQVKIDLDDGVKVNYPKFGGALSPIKGL